MSRVEPFEVNLEPDGNILVQTSDGDEVWFEPLQIRTALAMTPAALEKAVELIDADVAGDCS